MKEDQALLVAARKFFRGRKLKSWPLALKKAGFDHHLIMIEERDLWTRAKIISELQRREREQLPSSRVQVMRADASLVCAADNHFGSWGAARAAAGLGPASSRGGKQKWTRESVIADIQERCERGEDPAPSAMVVTGAYQAVYRLHLFDGWKQAVEAAGRSHCLTRPSASDRCGPRKRFPTPAYFVTKLRELAASSGLRLNAGRSDDPDSFQSKHATLYRTGIKFFGTWPQAVRSARLHYPAQESRATARPVIRVTFPSNWVSLDQTIGGEDGRVTRMHFYGSEDPGFDTAENRLALRAIYRQNKLGPDANALLGRMLDGQDLDENEYEFLASVVRAQPGLVEMLTAA